MREPFVYIIDDDNDVRAALQLLLESVGLGVKVFENALDYLQQFDMEQPGCIILDVRMPGMSGLELQNRLGEEKYHPPIIIITGHGDVPMAVKAVQAGAIDFIEKPFNNQTMLDVVHRAIDKDANDRGLVIEKIEIEKKYQSLTPREQQVMLNVVSGMRNKVIAAELNITQSTVEAHRAKVMEKMQAKSISELMRMALILKLI